MQKSTAFGIKVTIGSMLLTFLFVIVSYYLLGGGYREAIHNRLFMGIYTTILTFVAVLVTAKLILKNSKFSKEDANLCLDRGWRVYAGISVVLFLLQLPQTMRQGAVFAIFSVLSVVAGCVAFFFLKARQHSAK